MQEKCSFSKLKLHYAGQVTSPDHTFREVFVTADIPGSDTIGLWSCPMNRVNPLLLGMWEGDGYGSGGFSKDEKIICQVCESYVSIDEDNCPFCKYKLLKSDIPEE